MSGTEGRSPTCWGAAGSRTAAPAAAKPPGPTSAPGTTPNSQGGCPLLSAPYSGTQALAAAPYLLAFQKCAHVLFCASCPDNFCSWDNSNSQGVCLSLYLHPILESSRFLQQLIFWPYKVCACIGLCSLPWADFCSRDYSKYPWCVAFPSRTEFWNPGTCCSTYLSGLSESLHMLVCIGTSDPGPTPTSQGV